MFAVRRFQNDILAMFLPTLWGKRLGAAQKKNDKSVWGEGNNKKIKEDVGRLEKQSFKLLVRMYDQKTAIENNELPTLTSFESHLSQAKL